MLYCNWVSISSHFRDNRPQNIGVTTLTFLGHVTSSVAWPIDLPYAISYWCPIGTKPLSLTFFEIFGLQYPSARAHTHTRSKWSAPCKCNVLHWTDNNAMSAWYHSRMTQTYNSYFHYQRLRKICTPDSGYSPLIIIIIIIIPGRCLWCCHHAVAALREFTLVHAESAARRQVAADLWTKPMVTRLRTSILDPYFLFKTKQQSYKVSAVVVIP